MLVEKKKDLNVKDNIITRDKLFWWLL